MAASPMEGAPTEDPQMRAMAAPLTLVQLTAVAPAIRRSATVAAPT